MSGYQVMPRLSPDEYADLESDIVAHGVMVPITVSTDGVIVDGHHRDEIARKHDLHCPRVTANGTESELRGLAFSLNLNRRHLNREQRRELIAESLRSDPELSNREHARRTGVSDNTVGSVRREMEAGAQIAHLDTRTAPDGKTYPASQPDRPRATAMPQADLDALNAATEDQDADPEPPHWEPAGQMTPAAVQAITPEKPKRKPLTDDAHRIGWEIRKTAEKLDRLTEDDRWTRNTEKVTPLLRGHLQEAISTYTRILAELEGK